MSDRPWLEALKNAMGDRSADTDETAEKMSEAIPVEERERCKSLTDEPSPLVNVQTAEKVGSSWGEEERMLIAAGWTPKERSGLVIWANPESGFYCSQEVALHLLKRRVTL